MKQAILVNYHALFNTIGKTKNKPAVTVEADKLLSRILEHFQILKKYPVVFYAFNSQPNKEAYTNSFEQNNIKFENIFFGANDEDMLRNIRNAGYEPIIIIDKLLSEPNFDNAKIPALYYEDFSI